MSSPLLRVDVRQETDVVVARQRARQIAALLGFRGLDQVRIATAISELARNIVQYAGRGQVEFSVDLGPSPAVFLARVSDSGPGIADLDAILSGRYRSATGMGMGITGARRMMDRFAIESLPGKGTTIVVGMSLPAPSPALDARGLGRVAESLARELPARAVVELQQQNQELLTALDEIQRREEELTRLRRELQDTNRGVVALYAEIDDRAESLKRADALKSRFLSNVSHEFRTPLNSILALSRLLEERADGELGTEQARQVGYIRIAAQDLTVLVNDLLDLAKVEAGRTVVRPGPVDVQDLFNVLRGMLRPLAIDPAVSLELHDLPEKLVLHTDEGKVAQVLRNLVSNALKFTEKGVVTVSVQRTPGGHGVVFSVTDSGIGIAPHNHERVFQEFGQVENALQQRVKGTGLGLPLSRRLAELLGGSLTLRSALGEGSTFLFELPFRYSGPTAEEEPAAPGAATQPESIARGDVGRALIVDDDEAARYRLRRTLEALGFAVLEAELGQDGLAQARKERPDAVFLDLRLPDGSGFDILETMSSDPQTADIPVVVVSSSELTRAQVARLQQPGTAFVPKDAWSAANPETVVHEALLRAGWGARVLDQGAS